MRAATSFDTGRSTRYRTKHVPHRPLVGRTPILKLVRLVPAAVARLACSLEYRFRFDWPGSVHLLHAENLFGHSRPKCQTEVLVYNSQKLRALSGNRRIGGNEVTFDDDCAASVVEVDDEQRVLHLVEFNHFAKLRHAAQPFSPGQ